MNKIPTLFVRDFEHSNGRYVTRAVTPGCEWVLAGEGVATRKYDGTCVMNDGVAWWSRREVKAGKSTPNGFVPLEKDDITGKTVGWEPIEQGAFYKFWQEAMNDDANHGVARGAGTYELCGPKINGNPEGFQIHTLVRHANAQALTLLQPEFDYLAEWLGRQSYEGVVWHHPDGRMAKIKKKDFPRD